MTDLISRAFSAICHLTIALAAGLGLAAQSPLTTLFASNNGGQVGGLVMFDLTVFTPITLTQIDVNSGVVAGTAGSLQVRLIPGSYQGNEHDPAAWTIVSTGNPLVTAPTDTPTPCTLATPVGLPAGNYGVMLVSDTWRHRYTNGSTSYATSELVIDLGAAQSVPFSGLFAPRIANINLHYQPGATAPAWVSSFGDGCGEPLGELTLAASGQPLLGTTVGLHGLFTGNAGWAANILSLSRLTAPWDLTVFGMPGCYLHVTTDVVQLVPTAIDGTATTTFAIPNIASLAGLPIYSQAAAFDSGHNPLGVTTSNAVELRVGAGSPLVPGVTDSLLIAPLSDLSQLVETSPGQLIPFDVFEFGQAAQPHTVTWSTSSPNVSVVPATTTFGFGDPARHTLHLQSNGALTTTESFSIFADVAGPVLSGRVTSDEPQIQQPQFPPPPCRVIETPLGGAGRVLDANVVLSSDKNGPNWVRRVAKTGPGSLRVALVAWWVNNGVVSWRIWVTDFTCTAGCALPLSCVGTVLQLPAAATTLSLSCNCQ